MIPRRYLSARVNEEIGLVLAFLPWLPRPGVKVDTSPGSVPTLYYHWSAAEHAPYLIVPPDPWDTDDVSLQRLIRHEMGHLWADAWGRRNGGADIYPRLGIDGLHFQRHEIAAEVFARVMGEQPLYPDLESLSRPTPERIALVERSGEVPDRSGERAQLGVSINAFWGSGVVPQWYRDYAPLLQRWLDLYLVQPMRTRQ